MAKRLGINIDVKFDNKKNISQKLKEVLAYAQKENKISVDLDTKNVEKSLNELNKLLRDVQSKFANFGVFDKMKQDFKETEVQARKFKQVVTDSLNIGDGSKGFNELQLRATEIVETVDKLANISYKTDATGNMQNAIITYKNELGQVVTETMGWVSTTDKASNTVTKTFKTLSLSVNENISSIEKLESKISKIKDSMNIKVQNLRGNDLIDPAVIDNIQSKLNSITTATPEREIKELELTLKRLGSSESGIVRLSNELLKIDDKLHNFKTGKFKDIITQEDINEIERYKSSLIDLLNRLERGESIGDKIIPNAINENTSNMRNMTNNLNNAYNSQQKLNKETTTWGKTLSEVGTKVGLFSLAYTAINQLSYGFRNGINSVIEIDSAIRDLNRVTEQGEYNVDKFIKKSNELAISLGHTTQGVIEATTMFKKLGYSFNEASNYMASSALILSNVGDMSVEDSVKSITSTLKGFKMEASETTQIIDQLNEVGNNFAISTGEIAEGLRVASAPLSLANNDLGQTIAMITASNEVMQDVNTVSNGLKTISMRLRGVSEDGEELDAKLGDLIKNMTGVDLTDANGEFRSTFDILNDIGKVWDELDDKQQALLLEKVAGKNRANVLASLLQNSEQLDAVYQKTAESAGSAKKEQEAYMNSIEGKLNALSEKAKALFLNFINSDMIKGIVDGGSAVIDVLIGMTETFGSLGTSVGVLTTAFLLFTNNPLKQFVKGLVESKTTISTVKTVISTFTTAVKTNGTAMGTSATMTSLLSTGFKALGNSAIWANIKVMALQATLTFGLGLAITAIIGGLTSLGGMLTSTQQSLSEFNDEIKENVTATTESITSTEALYKKLQSLQSQLNQTDDLSKRKQLQQEIVDIQSQLALSNSDLISSYDSEGRALATNNALIENSLRLKKLELQEDAKSFLQKNTNLNQLTDKYKSVQDEISKMEEATAKGMTSYNGVVEGYNGKQSHMMLGFRPDDIKKGYENLTEYNKQMAEAELIINSLRATGMSDKDITALGFDLESIDEFNRMLEENQSILNGTEEALSGVGQEADDTTSSIKELTGAFDQNNSTIKILEQAIKEFNEYGGITEETMSKIFNSGDKQLISLLKDQNTFLDGANKMLGDQYDLREKNRQAIIDSASAEINFSNESAKARTNNEKQVVDNNSKNYKVDDSNLASAEKSKVNNHNNAMKNMDNATRSMVQAQSGYYSTDAQNFANATNSKINNIRALGKSMKDMAGIAERVLSASELRNKINPNLDNTVSTYNPTSVGIAGNYGGTSGSSSSSSTQKDIENLDSLIDRYYEYDNVLQLIENQLNALATAKENTDDKEKIGLLQQEIELLNKKKSALENLKNEQIKQMNEMQNIFKSKGFIIGADGSITNMNSRLEQLRNEANSKTGDAKKEAIEQVKNLQKLIDEYTKLWSETIPKTTDSINDLKNETISAQKEIASILEQQRDEYIDKEKEKTDATKKELEKRKKLQQDMWKEEDRADDLADKRKQVSELEDQLAMALRTGDEELAKSIRQQILEAQKVLNDSIRDNERDDILDRYDKESEKLDEDLQNRIDSIMEKFSDEELLKLAQNGVIDLTNSLKEIDQTSNGMTKAFNAISDIINNTWTTGIEKVYDKMLDLSKLAGNMSLGVNTNNPNVMGNKSINVSIGDLIYNGNGNGVDKAQISDMFNDFKDGIINEVGTLINQY